MFNYQTIIALLSIAFLSVRANANTMVKIAVEKNGIYEITPEELSQMGFSSADDVAVYGFGGYDADVDYDAELLPEVPTMITTDGRLLFYGQGPKRFQLICPSSSFIYTAIENNSYSTRGYYFLAAKQGARRVESVTSAPSGTVFDNHHCAVVYHPQITNPAHAGSTYMGENIAQLDEKKINIEFPTPDMRTNGWLGLRLRCAIKASMPRLSYTFNGSTRNIYTLARTSNLDNYESYFDATDFAQNIFQVANPAQAYNLEVNLSNSGTAAFAAVESATVTYDRLNILHDEESELPMYFWNISAGNAIQLSGADEDTYIWDVTNAVNPVQLEGQLADGTLTVGNPATHNGSSAYICFNATRSHHKIEIVGEVQLGLTSSITVPEMVIITAPKFRQEALRLAKLHLDYQGMEVAVVEQEDIFNDFSSGTMSPYAIQRFAKTLYKRDPAKFKHLLIFGAATYDPSGRLNSETLPDINVLTFETPDFNYQGNAAKDYCSDAFFAFFEPKESIMKSMMAINVSRIPASTTSQASSYVDKVERYLSTPPVNDTRSHALVAGDYGDSNGHIKQAMQLCDSITKWAPYVNITKAMASLFPGSTGNTVPMRQKVTSSFNNGIGYMAYSGHANASSLGSDEFMKRANVNQLSHSDNPFIMLSTCYTLGFDRGENGIAEVFLFSKDGGAIAVVGSGRAVQMVYNQYINLSVAKEFFTLRTSNCVGDVFRSARNGILTVNNNSELTVNTSNFNLIGDPALPLYSHTHAIEMDADNSATITPLSNNVIKGRVINSDNETDTQFNGRVVINLYAPLRTDLTRYDKQYDNNEAEPIEVKRREEIVASVVGTITNGVFETTLNCPAVPTPGEGHRLSVHAIAAETHHRAVSIIDDISVADTPSEPEHDTSIAPEINSLYLNDISFRDGDIVGSNFTVLADITASPTGLSTINTIDRSSYIQIDEHRYNDIASKLHTDEQGNVSISYNINGMTDGNHTLTLVISDNAGNHASASCDFVVITHPDEEVTLQVEEMTATTQATISLIHKMTVEPQGRIIIEDTAGNTVFSQSGVSFPFTWYLTDNDGNAIADGKYKVRAMVKAGQLHATTPPATIVVVNE